MGFAGDEEILKKIKEMEISEEGLLLVVLTVDFLDYQSILEALKGCSALFCCLESSDGYDVTNFTKSIPHP